MTLLTVEEALRFAAATQLFALTLLLWRERRQSRVPLPTALFVVSVACYLVLPSLLTRSVPPPIQYVVMVGALAIPFAFWLATRLHFEDGFSAAPRQVAILIVLLAARVALAAGHGATSQGGYGPTSGTLASNGVAMLVIADALRRIHQGARADLLLTRLRLRYAVLLACGVYALVVPPQSVNPSLQVVTH